MSYAISGTNSGRITTSGVTSGSTYVDNSAISTIAIFRCTFNSLASASQGGAIYVSGSSMRVITIDAMYINCSSSYSSGCGGGIFFDTIYEVSMNRNCGFSCVTQTGTGQFFYSYLASQSSTFDLGMTSTVYSSNPASVGYHAAMYFTNGNNTIKNINSSYNYVMYHRAGLGTAGVYGFLVTHSLFSSNYGTSTIWAFQSSYYNNYQDTIFHNNTCTSSGIITAESAGCYLMLRRCYFSKNSGVMFSTYSGTGTIYAYDCLSDTTFNTLGTTSNCTLVNTVVTPLYTMEGSSPCKAVISCTTPVQSKYFSKDLRLADIAANFPVFLILMINE